MPTPTLAGFGSLRTLKSERIGPRIRRKLVAGERGMIVWWRIKAGAHAAAHKHRHEQIFWILKGSMRFRIGGKTKLCKAGDFAVIPGGVEHEAWWPEDCEVIDVFSPPREDFLAGGPPAYMRDAKPPATRASR